mmetsp:Transcript_12997/g.23581  ORF Transcript_12997/g.23581 Transcript_12997/m.23581 type:complete len:251 (-) Transcript_12997:995-1747(-)
MLPTSWIRLTSLPQEYGSSNSTGTNKSLKASSTTATKSLSPSPVKLLIPTEKSSAHAASYLIISASSGSNKSNLLNTLTSGMSPAPISSNTPVTDASCFLQVGLLTSTMCTNTSASFTSSNVALNAATNCVGNFCMNPTVSVNRTSGWVLYPGSFTLLVVGSSVANRMSSANIPAFVRQFSSVDFPALVYPTRARTGNPPLLRPRRCKSRCFCTPSIFPFSTRIRSLKIRLSTSSCVSPGPRNPTPPEPD